MDTKFGTYEFGGNENVGEKLRRQLDISLCTTDKQTLVLYRLSKPTSDSRRWWWRRTRERACRGGGLATGHCFLFGKGAAFGS